MACKSCTQLLEYLYWIARLSQRQSGAFPCVISILGLRYLHVETMGACEEIRSVARGTDRTYQQRFCVVCKVQLKQRGTRMHGACAAPVIHSVRVFFGSRCCVEAAQAGVSGSRSTHAKTLSRNRATPRNEHCRKARFMPDRGCERVAASRKPATSSALLHHAAESIGGRHGETFSERFRTEA